jgi:hypothetical protein
MRKLNAWPAACDKRRIIVPVDGFFGPRPAHGLTEMANSHNLKRRLARPAAGNGRLRRGALRALWAHDGPITTSEAMEFTHTMRLYRGEPIRSIHYHRARLRIMVA